MVDWKWKCGTESPLTAAEDMLQGWPPNYDYRRNGLKKVRGHTLAKFANIWVHKGGRCWLQYEALCCSTSSSYLSLLFMHLCIYANKNTWPVVSARLSTLF